MRQVEMHAGRTGKGRARTIVRHQPPAPAHGNPRHAVTAHPILSHVRAYARSASPACMMSTIRTRRQSTSAARPARRRGTDLYDVNWEDGEAHAPRPQERRHRQRNCCAPSYKLQAIDGPHPRSTYTCGSVPVRLDAIRHPRLLPVSACSGLRYFARTSAPRTS